MSQASVWQQALEPRRFDARGESFFHFAHRILIDASDHRTNCGPQGFMYWFADGSTLLNSGEELRISVSLTRDPG